MTDRRAGRAGRSRRGALNKEVGDVHGIGEGLEAARRHAANGTDQSQDTAVHQLTGWMERKGGDAEEEGEEKKDKHINDSSLLILCLKSPLADALATSVYFCVCGNSRPKHTFLF